MAKKLTKKAFEIAEIMTPLNDLIKNAKDNKDNRAKQLQKIVNYVSELGCTDDQKIAIFRRLFVGKNFPKKIRKKDLD